MEANTSLDNDLTQQQRTAVELLLQGLSDAQVAAQLGTDRTTIFRWRKSEDFAAELDFHRRKLLEQSTARLQTLLDPALDILQKQLKGDDPKTALRAAAILVRMATPSRIARPPAPKHQRPRTADEARRQFNRALEEYIEAPMPGQVLDEEDDDDAEDE